MHILTDFPRFPTFTKLPNGMGVRATTVLKEMSYFDLPSLLPELRKTDLILIQDPVKILGVAMIFTLAPFLRKPIIAVDLILRTPHTPKQRLIAWVKKFLLKRVNHFIHYFESLEGYTKYYGITDARSSYVPFKSNMHGNPRVAGLKLVATEEFVFSAGRSLRDYDTLFEALSVLNYPAAIPKPNFEQLHQHGSRFTWTLENLPKNLTLLEDDGTPESWIRNLNRAKVVVIPTRSDSLCASGIGTYLDAMSLKKCVVISGGPGVSELLKSEAIIVPPENPAALAEGIKKAWEDSELRSSTAMRGYLYASAFGGEPELMQRLLRRSVEWQQSRNPGDATNPISPESLTGSPNHSDS